jgi:tRNA dimethylallyltransferase
MMKKDKKLYIIAGPTSVGKTQKSIEFSIKNDACILSSDPSLFYKELNIGTDKPSLKYRKRIKHYGIDISSIKKNPVNIKQYISIAVKSIEKIHSCNKRVVIAGASGFYLEVFFRPVINNYNINLSLRKKIEKRYHKNGLKFLIKWLKRIGNSEEDLLEIDLKNPIRVLRAIERCIILKIPIKRQKNFLKKSNFDFLKYEKKIFLIDRNDDDLKYRIQERIKKMFKKGFVKEVIKIKNNNFENNKIVLNNIGYKEILLELENTKKNFKNYDYNFKFSKRVMNELNNKIFKRTWNLVKKQRRWFKNRFNSFRKFKINLSNNSDQFF